MINLSIREYRIEALLGKGGMATVYLARHQKNHKHFALKLLNQEYVQDSNIRKRFVAEARSMAKMAHGNIVKVHELIDAGDIVAIVMDYIEGNSLKEYLHQKSRLSDEEIGLLLIQMLQALDYVHEQKLVHRDVKPSNFMVNSWGGIRLMDFGIAKTLDSESVDYTQTGTGHKMGTPMYMSPEQVLSSRSVDKRSDIYSLGVVLWQMVSCRRPYDAGTLSEYEIQNKIVNEHLAPTHTDWDELIAKACQKKPEHRFQSCSAWLASLTNPEDDEENERKEKEAEEIDSLPITVNQNSYRAQEALVILLFSIAISDGLSIPSEIGLPQPFQSYNFSEILFSFKFITAVFLGYSIFLSVKSRNHFFTPFLTVNFLFVIMLNSTLWREHSIVDIFSAFTGYHPFNPLFECSKYLLTMNVLFILHQGLYKIIKTGGFSASAAGMEKEPQSLTPFTIRSVFHFICLATIVAFYLFRMLLPDDSILFWSKVLFRIYQNIPSF